jgi:hypothetical protein
MACLFEGIAVTLTRIVSRLKFEPLSVTMVCEPALENHMKQVIQKKPEISVTPARVKLNELVMLNGTGFTPDRPVLSHLRKPDGTEYNPLRLRSNTRGELVHKIDTVMLDLGAFEAWVEDEDAKVVSNRVQFTVVP